jgi:hypothetical protein
MIGFISPSLVLYLIPLAATFFLNALVFALGSLGGVVAFRAEAAPSGGYTNPHWPARIVKPGEARSELSTHRLCRQPIANTPPEGCGKKF